LKLPPEWIPWEKLISKSLPLPFEWNFSLKIVLAEHKKNLRIQMKETENSFLQIKIIFSI